jgi:hypothetical protein
MRRCWSILASLKAAIKLYTESVGYTFGAVHTNTQQHEQEMLMPLGHQSCILVVYIANKMFGGANGYIGKTNMAMMTKKKR